ncbi:MAG: hypothetical protein KDC83_15430, partial [Flavobacteriales bacterium]|nr:hypothetical protein [Flavobacteriales bacterium]
KRSVRRLRFAFLGVFYLFAAILATTWAILQFQRAQEESNVKNSLRLSFLAQDISEQNPTLALLLATEGLNTADTTESFNTTLSLNINSKGLPGFLIQHPVENGESITAEWSNDGTKIFTISSKELSIWDAENSQVLATFTHETDLELAKWNPTDEQILVVSKSEIIVWDWQTNNQIFTHERENLSRIFAILWNSDGSDILAVEETSITIWDVKTNETLRSFTHTGFVSNIEWSKDSSKLLMTGDGKSQILSAEDGQVLQTFGEGRASWNQSESLVFTVGTFVRVWNALTGESLNNLPIQFAGNQQITWHSNSHIQVVSADSVQIFDAITSELLYRLDTHKLLSQAYWSPKQNYILTVDETGSVWVWNSDTQTEVFTIHHESDITHAEWGKDGKYILTIHENGVVQVWDAEANSGLFTQNIDGAVRDVEVSPGGEYIFVIGRKDADRISNSLHVLDFKGNELMSEELGLVTTAKWDEHGRYILLTVLSDFFNQKFDVQIWDAFTGQMLYSISTGKGVVTRVEWDKENDRLLTISSQQYQVWDLRSAIIISSFEANGVTLEDTKTGNEVTTFLTERFFTPHGDLFWEQITKLNLDLENEGTFNSDKSFYIEPFGHTAFIYDSVTGEKVGSLEIENSIVDASFHPEKENILILTTSFDTHVYKYNIRSTDGTYTSFSYKLFTLAGGNAFWSEQGNFIVTILGSVNVFDSESGELLHAISIDNSRINHASRIDNNILIGTEKGMVALIPFSRDGLLEISCNRLVRNFMQTEWQNYFQDEEYRKTCENLPIHSSVSPES